MVKDSVWFQAARHSHTADGDLRLMFGRGFLCIACLEHRLGRQLTRADFTDAPVNDASPWNTALLARRLEAVA